MIGRVRGRLVWKGSDHVLIETGGIGWQVLVDQRTLAALGPIGGPVTLWTEFLLREDGAQLVGFRTLYEREWHRLLISVQGVGPKAALTLLGTLGPEGLAQALALSDLNRLQAAPGIGRKLAQRLVLELKDKAPSLMALAAQAKAKPASEPLEEADTTATVPTPPSLSASRAATEGRKRRVARESDHAAPPSPLASATVQAEALSALQNLGYTPAEAAAAVAEAAPQATDTAGLIRAALRLLAPPGHGHA